MLQRGRRAQGLGWAKTLTKRLRTLPGAPGAPTAGATGACGVHKRTAKWHNRQLIHRPARVRGPGPEKERGKR
ncbi:hypothetical protein GCM10009839_50440 [Catenulispora yoronensis]|uniref:Uncharacterized protein n=1 Tax=Catenulispora yoronensis TaxID=450799 RepID=A0ABP5G9T4_9ACTN